MNGKVILLIVIFAIYTGYKFLSVSVSKSQMQAVVEGVLDDIDKETSDKSIKMRLIRRASAGAAPIDEGQIEVTRETRPGERITHVDVRSPLSISYLGTEWTLDGDVRGTKIIKVNEAYEARRAEGLRKAEERRLKQRAFAAEHSKKVEEAWFECEEMYGKGNCRLNANPGGKPGEIEKSYLKW